jgi:predicted MFS family arabinose efflux permease
MGAKQKMQKGRQSSALKQAGWDGLMSDEHTERGRAIAEPAAMSPCEPDIAVTPSAHQSADLGKGRNKIPIRIWYALAMLTVMNILAAMDRVALSILLEPIKIEMALSDKQLGLLSGMAFALFYALLGLPIAALADRKSRVKIVSICLAIWSAMTALGGIAQNYTHLFLARMGVGIGEAGCIPPAHSLIGDYFGRTRRAMALSLFNAGAAVGGAGGMFLIGWLAQEHGWRTSLQIVGLFGLPIALLSILTLREPARPQTATASRETPFQTIVALLRRPAYVHIIAAFSLSQVCAHGFSPWVPPFLIRSFGMELPEIGAWLGGFSVGGGMVGVLAGGFLASALMPRDLRWELWIPTIALTITACCIVVVVLSQSAALTLSMIAITHFMGGAAAVAVSGIQSFAEPHRRATAVAMVMLLGSLIGGGVGSYLIGMTSDLLMPTLGSESLRYAFLLVSLIQLWGALHYWLASRNAATSRIVQSEPSI